MTKFLTISKCTHSYFFLLQTAFGDGFNKWGTYYLEALRVTKKKNRETRAANKRFEFSFGTQETSKVVLDHTFTNLFSKIVAPF